MIFPSDSTGEPNKIKYESTEFELFDEETNWFTEIHNYRTYNWVVGAMQPAFKREYSLEEELETDQEIDAED